MSTQDSKDTENEGKGEEKPHTSWYVERMVAQDSHVAVITWRFRHTDIDYASTRYWNNRYSTRDTPFEWYACTE